VRLDRVAHDIYVFVSGLYAQVTATVLLTPAGAILIDTLPFPSETRQVVSFVEGKLGSHQVRYVVCTHHQGDHVYGSYLFPEAEIVAHDRCREMLGRLGHAALERAKRDGPALAGVELRLPDITFQKEMHLHLAHRHPMLFHTPGNTSDGISGFVMGEKVVVAGDAMMPVPYIVHGDRDQLRQTVALLGSLKPNFIVQGHGGVLLRGEVDEATKSALHYLDAIENKVGEVVERGDPASALDEIDIESCGKSRIPLDGLVGRLHRDNLLALYKELREAQDRQA